MDEGLSENHGDNCPGMRRAITHVCESREMPVAYRLSRLARSTREAVGIAGFGMASRVCF
jgi:hypothetical protein